MLQFKDLLIIQIIILIFALIMEFKLAKIDFFILVNLFEKYGIDFDKINEGNIVEELAQNLKH